MIGYRRYSSQLELPEVTRANDRVGGRSLYQLRRRKGKIHGRRQGQTKVQLRRMEKELVRWGEKRRHGRKQHMVYGINLHYIRNAPVAEPEKTYKLLKGMKSRDKKSTRRKKRTGREGI